MEFFRLTAFTLQISWQWYEMNIFSNFASCEPLSHQVQHWSLVKTNTHPNLQNYVSLLIHIPICLIFTWHEMGNAVQRNRSIICIWGSPNEFWEVLEFSSKSFFPIKFDDLVLLSINCKQAEVNICDSLGYFFKGAIHKFCHNPHAHNDFKLSSILWFAKLLQNNNLSYAFWLQKHYYYYYYYYYHYYYYHHYHYHIFLCLYINTQFCL